VKDVKTTEVEGKKQKQFKIAGEGDLNVVGLLKALKAIDYQYCLALEYEENAKNPLPDIESCLKHVRECAAKV
jgi:sugar phosphate isomerase/epimerase